MATVLRHLSCYALIIAICFASGCADRRKPKAAPLKMQSIAPPRTSADSVASVQFQGQATEVLQIFQKNDSLFLTGRPFGFSRWDVSVNPENPRLLFAASDNIPTFAPNGRWIVDHLAAGALTVLGNYAFMSGSAGSSIVSFASNTPVEKIRKPFTDPNAENIEADPAFQYRAFSHHPTLPLVYGFREQDYVYTLKVTGDVPLVAKNPYQPDGGTICCVRNAQLFGNRIFVAFSGSLVWYDFAADGSLDEPGEMKELQASWVAASRDRLYVQHEPNSGQPQGQQYPAGIYVFDLEGNHVDTILVKAARVFAVNNRNSHLFLNFDNQNLEIYQINWASPVR